MSERAAREAPPRRKAGLSLAGPRMAHGQVAEIQRSRLLAAAVAAIERVGYERATVAQITAHARVSRRTFYELFTNREECIAAVLQSTAEQVRNALKAASLQDVAWGEQMRLGLWRILCFLDSEPGLARVLVLAAQRGSGPVLAEREAIIHQLAALVDEGRAGKTGGGCSELTAQGVLGATLAIISADLARQGQHKPLTRLFGELLGIILLPYFGSTVTRREQARPAPSLPPAIASPGRPTGVDPLAGLQMRLTYRTAQILQGIGAYPGASNRQAADYAGISDQGQVSKLLARLERLGLLTNNGAGQLRGEPNSWQLTSKGQLVTESIRAHTTHKRRAA
jgi:AcrR family transcriptional regulator